MKTILIVLVGVLVWTNNDARTFTAKALYRAAEFVSPEPESRSIGETIEKSSLVESYSISDCTSSVSTQP